MAARSSDAIVFVGLNPTAGQEAQALRKLGNKVFLVANGKTTDRVRFGGRAFDLTDSAQVTAFLARLRLTPDRIAMAAAALRGAGSDVKDELGQLAVVWATAERRRAFAGRMVLSGEHAGGATFWGKGAQGWLRIADIAALANAFPRAANAVEDLHLSACNSAVEVQAFTKVFPHVKTIWAYIASCPGTFTGAAVHLRLWDRATRGAVKTLDHVIASGTRKGDHVAVWTRLGGLTTGEVNSIEVLRARVAATSDMFETSFDGRAVVVDTGSGPLREYYETLQAMLRHHDLPDTERFTIENRRDVTIRLLYYDKTVKKAFATHHAALIASGYSALAIPVPDFARLSRKEALASIAEFEARASTTTKEPAERLRPYLTEGLRQLKEQYIPVNWI